MVPAFSKHEFNEKKNKITFTYNINGLFLFSRCFKSQNDRVAVCLVRHTWNTHIHMLQLECLYGICSIYPIYYTLCFHILIIALKWKRIKRKKNAFDQFRLTKQTSRPIYIGRWQISITNNHWRKVHNEIFLCPFHSISFFFA